MIYDPPISLRAFSQGLRSGELVRHLGKNKNHVVLYNYIYIYIHRIIYIYIYNVSTHTKVLRPKRAASVTLSFIAQARDETLGLQARGLA